MRRRPTILVVDAQENRLRSLCGQFEISGHEAHPARSVEEAVEKLGREVFDLVLVEGTLRGLQRIKEKFPTTLVVIMAADGAVESAMEAMREGADDWVVKPLESDLLAPLVTRLMRMRALMDENALLREQVFPTESFQKLVGRSPSMQRLSVKIQEAARTNSPVLITGEMGTGKEMVAKAIHALSSRARAPFVPVRCGILGEQLLENELFGREKGEGPARRGRLEMGDGGTLYVDDVGDLSPRMQLDVLKILEEKRFYRVGGEKPMASDVRIIAATTRDLEEAVSQGRFRAELLYRLNVISVDVPPLRERREDIPRLARHFLARFGREMKKPVEDIRGDALDLLMNHPWPGNVRELRNAMERAVVVATSRHITAEDLAFLAQCRGSSPPVGMTLAEVERRHIENVMAHTKGNVSRAARLLGVHRSTLHKKAREYGITWKRGRGRPRKDSQDVETAGF